MLEPIRTILFMLINIFIIDIESVPFHVSIKLVSNLSSSIITDLSKSIIDHLISKSKKNSKGYDLPDHDSTFLYLIYETLKFQGHSKSIIKASSPSFAIWNDYTKSKEMKMSLRHLRKTYLTPQYVDILHSLQDNVETDWVFELVFESSANETFSIRKQLSDFFKSPMAKNLETVSTPIMMKILKGIANCFHVKRGFTGDNRETPVPKTEKFDQFEQFSDFVDSSIMDIAGLIGKTIFRHIGAELDYKNITHLFTLLCYSDSVQLNPNVKEVLENLLSHGVFFVNPKLPSSILLWKAARNLPEIKMKEKVKSHSNVCALFYYFVQWYNNSSIKNVLSLKKVAEIFNLAPKIDGENINYIDFLTSDFKPTDGTWSVKYEDIKFVCSKPPSVRHFHEWAMIFQWVDDEFGISKAKNIGQFKVNEDIYETAIKDNECGMIFNRRFVNEQISVGFDLNWDYINESFEQMKSFVQKNGFTFDTCMLCVESRPRDIIGIWELLNCKNGCDRSICICSECHKTNYNKVPEPGRMLQMSTISCINCRSISINIETRFPMGTNENDIVEFGNQYYSCCAGGCRNFVHVPPEEGVTCAYRRENIVNTFCVTHSVVLGNEVQTMMKPCPGCNQMIFKVDGCNHMTCTNCATEFCMRPECTYFSSPGTVFNHPSYCRMGISDEITIEGLFHVVSRIYENCSHNGYVSQETSLFASTVLTNIVFLGLDYSIYGVLYQLFDYIGNISVLGSNRVTLNTTLNRLITSINRVYPTNLYFDEFVRIQRNLMIQ